MERRRASGELIGAQLRKARLDADQALLPPPEPQPSVLTPEKEVQRDARTYLASGNRYEALVSRLLAERPEVDDGQTLILAGYGAGLRVEKDALIVTEGHTHHPQAPVTHTLWRGMHRVARIVCLDPKGSLSFSAIQWCTEQNITLFLLDRSGGLVSTFTPEPAADALLRRRQYLAEVIELDIPIAQELLRRKLHAQKQTVLRHKNLPGRDRAQEILDAALAWLALPELPP